MPSDQTQPETGTDTGAAPHAEQTAPSAPARLPDDHPLVKAYQATKAQLAEAKGKVKEFEDANLSEIERAQAKAAEAEQLAAAAQTENLRLQVAMELGLTASQARRLDPQATTREELEADANALLEELAPAPTTPVSPRPVEHLRGGTDPTAPLNGDPLLQAVKSKLSIR